MNMPRELVSNVCVNVSKERDFQNKNTHHMCVADSGSRINFCLVIEKVVKKSTNSIFLFFRYVFRSIGRLLIIQCPKMNVVPLVNKYY